MKKLLIIAILFGCGKSNDPAPIAANPLLGEWKLTSEQVLNCGTKNGSLTWTVAPVLKIIDGKSASIDGNPLEYSIKGDSLIFHYWKKGIYSINGSALSFSGKFITTSPFKDCSFKDQFQR